MAYTITTPLYYVNDKPHLGSSYTTIACDALARFNRLKGKDVRFITGVDEHGQKIQRTAESKNTDPQSHCDEVAEQYKRLWKKLNISYDSFVRTTSKSHKELVNEFYTKVLSSEDIVMGRQQGWYCVGCEEYKDDEHKSKSPKCPIHMKELEWRDEENIFFRLSKYQSKIEKLIQEPGFIRPETRKNEIIQFVSNGLKDFSISRKNLYWGLRVPEKEEHTFYVWFDALLGYITGSDEIENNKSIDLSSIKYWPASVHVIGKDILRFHAVYWPAMLMSAGIELPRTVFGHGFLTREGKKMGKSLGNVLDPEKLLNYSGVDAMRWYLLRDIQFGEDGDFQIKRYVDIVNNDLSNTIGNLLNRTLSMSSKWFNNKIPIKSNNSHPNELVEIIEKCVLKYNQSLEQINFKSASESILELANAANFYLNDKVPWKLIKEEENIQRVAVIIYTVLDTCRIIAYLLQPIVPNVSDKVISQLNLEISSNDWTDSLKPGLLPLSGYTNSPSPIMNKLEILETL